MNSKLINFRRSFEEFWLAPASPVPLGVLRIGTAGVLLLQLLGIRQDLMALYGPQGLMQPTVLSALDPLAVFSVQRLADVLRVDASWLLRVTYTAAMGSAFCLLIGWRTRAAAIFTWVAHLLLKGQGMPSNYGANGFVHIALFYLMLAPCADALSVDAGRKPIRASGRARLILRLVQIHLCVVYATSGLYKAQGVQWWNGEASWRALNMESFSNFPNFWLAHVPWLALMVSWGTLVLELGYAFFIWPSHTRRWWVVSTIAMHIGIAAVMGLYSFAAVMIVLNIVAFLLDANPVPAIAPVQVAYDGSCSICRTLVHAAWRLRPRAFKLIGRNYGRIGWLGNAVIKRQMYAFSSDGERLSGATAFMKLWAVALGTPFLTSVGRLKCVQRAYAWFSNNRQRLGCRSACSVSTKV